MADASPDKIEARVPVTASASRLPCFDRHGRQIFVGDRLRIQYCTGRYGQTAVVTMTVETEHWPYCSIGKGRQSLDAKRNALVGYYKHNDFEHGHEAWIEVIP